MILYWHIDFVSALNVFLSFLWFDCEIIMTLDDLKELAVLGLEQVRDKRKLKLNIWAGTLPTATEIRRTVLNVAERLDADPHDDFEIKELANANV